MGAITSNGRLTHTRQTLDAKFNRNDALDLTIIGGNGDDTIEGSEQDDTIASQGGHDTVDGNGGDDLVFAGEGRDSVDGGDGDDEVMGEDNNDTVNGGAGFDTIRGQRGEDSLTGGADADQLQGQFSDDFLDGGDGGDFLIGDLPFYGRADGNDTMLGGAGNDFLVGYLLDDVYDGGEGFDGAIFYNVFGGDAGATGDFGPVTVDLRIAGPQDTGQGMDTFISIEDLYATIFDDTLIGNEVDNLLFGAGGNDSIDGNEGNDVIFSGNQNMTASGGLGDDTVQGGSGNDVMNGNDGDDFLRQLGGDDDIGGGLGDDVVYLGLEGNVTVQGGDGTDWLSFFDNNQEGTEANPGAKVKFKLSDQGTTQTTQTGTVDAQGFENLAGGNWDDRLSGDTGDNVLAGDWGNDRLRGVDGDDALYGDGLVNGDGSFDPTGGVFPFFIDYRGGAYLDTLIGSRGDDLLNGGFGADVLQGGPGTDTYEYLHWSDSTFNFGTDRITGLQNRDVIDLSAIDATDDFDDTTADTSDDAFVLVDSFSGTAGELTISFDSVNGISLIKGDLDGDANADLLIEVNGDVRDYDNFVL
jgi:Ca2+-binding RTX toxin-like protein